jgi:MFS family permease
MNNGTTRKAGAGVWDASHRQLTIGLLLTISITAFEALAVATVLPETAADLGGVAPDLVSTTGASGAAMGWYGWVFSGFMLANLVGIPAAGVLSDRGGPARPFVLGMLLFAVGLLAAGLAPSMPLLVLGRVAQGFGAGALSSVAYVAVARGYDAMDQPRMLALLASAWVVPGLLGPTAAAAIAAAAGWRAVYLALVPLTLVAAVLAMRGMRELAPNDSSSSAMPSPSGTASMSAAVRLTIGSTLALVALQLPHVVLTVLAAGAGIAIGFPALKQLLPVGTLTAAAGAPAALAAKALVTFSFFGAEAFLPLSLTMVRGQSIAIAGFALTAGTLAWTAGTWIQERYVHRVDTAVFVRAGLALTAIAVAGAASVVVVSMPATVAIASWAIAGLGIGLSYPTTTLIVFDGTAKGDEGTAASALQLANVLGVALGTGVGGAILGAMTSAGRSETEAILLIDAVMFVAALIGFAAAMRSAETKQVRKIPETGSDPIST